jgi:hypothetical protein
MHSNPSKPPRRRARTPKGQFQGDDLTTPDINEAWAPEAPSEPISHEAAPLRKPAGKPAVRKRVGRPKVGTVEKVTKPTFGVVRGVYN